MWSIEFTFRKNLFHRSCNWCAVPTSIFELMFTLFESHVDSTAYFSHNRCLILTHFIVFTVCSFCFLANQIWIEKQIATFDSENTNSKRRLWTSYKIRWKELDSNENEDFQLIITRHIFILLLPIPMNELLIFIHDNEQSNGISILIQRFFTSFDQQQHKFIVSFLVHV